MSLDPGVQQQTMELRVLAEIERRDPADPVTRSSVYFGADERDIQAAVETLIEEGSLTRRAPRVEPDQQLAAAGELRVTESGRRRLEQQV